MTPINVIKDQYARMSDDELLHLSKNEADRLTVESFRLLMDEFRLRNLDLGILEAAKTEKELSGLFVKSEMEKNAAIEFNQSLFDYVIEERQKGKTTIELYNRLIKKGLTDQCAFVYIQGLNSRLKRVIEHFEANMILGCVLTVVGLAILTLYLMDYFKSVYVIFGIFLIIGGIVGTVINSINKSKYQKILKSLESDPLKLSYPYGRIDATLN
ncbi:hypothetical protein [Arachidicoccus terrestris]|uniref:hypothetical protein n=1 Tax=Arachidicoccus terrestris TaxID=2875539 RepID=UPI001CC5B45C|nr:hypothetical protein [Arachidicoccus terrestris]UAY54803.1 hypothetical protein K9M52_15345 [Arachidicoccus terrestris]